MKPIFFALILFAIFPAITLAQQPAPTPNTPYHFEPINIPAAPHDVPINFITIDFVNDMGSYALTVFALLDAYNVLGIFVVILLGTSALWWLYSFVTGKPINETLNISEGLGAADNLSDLYYDDLYQDAEASFRDDQIELSKARDKIDSARSRFRTQTRAARTILRESKKFRF